MGGAAQPDKGQVLVHPEARRLAEAAAEVVGAEPRRRRDVGRRDGLGVVFGDEAGRPHDLPVGGVDAVGHLLQYGADPAAGQQQLLQHGAQHGGGVPVGQGVLPHHPFQQRLHPRLMGLGRLQDAHLPEKRLLPRQGLPHRRGHILLPEKDGRPPAGPKPVAGIVEGVGRDE